MNYKKKIMKLFNKLLFTIALSGIAAIAFSQQNNVVSTINYLKDYTKYNEIEALQKAKQRIDDAVKHDDTKGSAKAWFYRGKVYHTLFDNAFNNQMKQIQEPDNNKKNVLAYQNVLMNDLDVALESYSKAIELDSKNDFTADANNMIKIIVLNYSYKSYSMYVGKKYEEAAMFGEKTFDLSIKYKTKTDTNALNTAAYCAAKTGQSEKAMTLYNKLLEMKYQPLQTYSYIIELYKQKNDMDGLKKTLASARKDYPNNYTLIVEELNIYIKEGKTNEAIQSLKLAIEKEPNNAELHLVLGQTYNKLAFPEDPEAKRPDNYDQLVKDAEVEYAKAVEIKPDYVNALYSFGVFYNNWGASIINASNKLTDIKKIEAEEKKANEIFLKAIPLLEKAHELDKTDKDTMRALKQLYAKTGQGGSEKYKKINELLKN